MVIQGPAMAAKPIGETASTRAPLVGACRSNHAPPRMGAFVEGGRSPRLYGDLDIVARTGASCLGVRSVRAIRRNYECGNLPPEGSLLWSLAEQSLFV